MASYQHKKFELEPVAKIYGEGSFCYDLYAIAPYKDVLHAAVGCDPDVNELHIDSNDNIIEKGRRGTTLVGEITPAIRTRTRKIIEHCPSYLLGEIQDRLDKAQIDRAKLGVGYLGMTLKLKPEEERFWRLFEKMETGIPLVRGEWSEYQKLKETVAPHL